MTIMTIAWDEDDIILVKVALVLPNFFCVGAVYGTIGQQ
jgi:hypothetical protein